MKLLQTSNERLAVSLYSFIKRRHTKVKPFILKQSIKFADTEFFSYAVGYESIKEDDVKKVHIEEPFFTGEEVEEMIYRHKKFDY